MANIDNPNGFHPLNGTCVRPPTAYPIEVTYSEDLFIGDLVALSGGYIVQGTAATDNALLGAIVGFECRDGGIKQGGYYPDDSAYTWYALVADDPGQRFVAQDDGAGTDIAQAHVGNTGIWIKGTGNKNTNLSGHEMDGSSFTTGNAVTDGLRLIGLVDKPGNAFGDNAEWIVEIHNHQLRQENNVDATS